MNWRDIGRWKVPWRKGAEQKRWERLGWVEAGRGGWNFKIELSGSSKAQRTGLSLKVWLGDVAWTKVEGGIPPPSWSCRQPWPHLPAQLQVEKQEKTEQMSGWGSLNLFPAPLTTCSPEAQMPILWASMEKTKGAGGVVQGTPIFTSCPNPSKSA